MKINKGAKIGGIIQIISLATMIVLIILNKLIPSLLVWVFNIGLVISLGGSLIALSTKKDNIRL